MSFWSFKVPFFEIWCPFQLCIYYNLLCLFLILDKVSTMTHCQACVWDCFPLLVTVFIKLVLCACNFGQKQPLEVFYREKYFCLSVQCSIRQRFERYFSHHWARWLEKYLSKRSLIKHKRKVFLEISENSQENTCARVFFNEVAGLRPVNFANFLRTPFLQNTFGICFYLMHFY